MKKANYLPDIIGAIVAIIVGLGFAKYLHDQWYEVWMSWLGDPPDQNPAYDRFYTLFTTAPYIAAGIATGIVAGFGSSQSSRVFIRSSALLVVFLLVSRNSHLALSSYVPAALAAFAFSTGLSIVYFKLLNAHVGTNNQ